MLATRMIMIDGLPDTGRTRLAQRLGLQLEAGGTEIRMPMRHDRGHPLRRDFVPDAYASSASYVDALEQQWHNFAIRAAAESDVWLCASSWLEPALTLHAEGVLDADAAVAVTGRLFSALAPLEPALLYLSRPAGGAAAGIADAAFAALSSHRTLLNAARLTPAELDAEALHFLNISATRIELAPDLLMRLAGCYGTPPGPVLELTPADGGLVLHGLDLRETDEAGRQGPRELLAAADGRLLVAGTDLELRVRLDDDGRALGLLTRTAEPALATLPDFLPRSQH